MPHEARREARPDVVGPPAARDLDAAARPRARVPDGPPAPGPAVRRPLVDAGVGPDGVRPLGSAPRAGAVRGPASPPPRGRDAPGAGTADAAGPGDDPGDPGGLVRRHPGGVPLRAARRGEDPTGPTRRDDQRGPRGRDRLAPARRAQKVPDATSVRMAVSSAWSATSFFRRPFSRSRSVRRFAWSTRRPPSSRRQRESGGSATPSRRATVPTFSPWARATSASRSVPMIGSAVYRFRAMPTPLVRPRSSHRIWTGSGGGRSRKASGELAISVFELTEQAFPTVRTPVLTAIMDARASTGDGGMETALTLGETIGRLHRPKRWRLGTQAERPGLDRIATAVGVTTSVLGPADGSRGPRDRCPNGRATGPSIPSCGLRDRQGKGWAR